ncbi:hypothetical protein SKDZ_15G1360 [Saccharomyces kudriavzevii ZP591]|nr:hypothetical protein SKDZ_15G1360 [Saccharomyces kudriavzevii ZP591]
MFRDRTNLFLSYRRTFPHNITFPSRAPLGDDRDIEMGSYPMADLSHDISARLMDERENKDTSHSDALPPIFIDIAQDVDDYLFEVRRLSEQLARVYRKNSLPGFDDKSHDEALVEDLSFKIIQILQKCYGVMKRLKTIHNSQFVGGKQLSREELIILDNLQKTYAEKIQTESNKFRVLQNNYLKFLNKDDLKPIRNSRANTEDTLLLDDEEGEAAREKREGLDIEDYSKRTLQRQQQLHDTTAEAYLRERDEEITQLARGVLEVSTIFREMQDLVIDQGTIVDRIDYNLENTVVELKSADKELNKATHYQKRTQKCKVILLLTLCVIALFFFVMLKPHGGGGGGNSHDSNNSSNGKNNGHSNDEDKELPAAVEVSDPSNKAPNAPTLMDEEFTVSDGDFRP